MKKTLSINLNGRVFNIDEDAYELLNNYLHNLKSYFSKEVDSFEIVKDFEARIEELFQERIKLGYNVISIEQVEIIIERMGKPEDFGNDGFEANENTEKTEKKDPEIIEKPKKRFYRNVDDKMIGGVCSGIAAFFGWDPLALRIVFFIMIFVTQLFMLPVYLFLWLFIPGAVTASQKLEMKGEAVTLENIGKTVSETTTTTTINNYNNNNGCLDTSLKFGLGCLGCFLAIPLLFVIISAIFMLAVSILGIGSFMYFPFDFLGFNPPFNFYMDAGIHPAVGSITLLLLLGIPLFFIIYALFSSKKNTKPLKNKTKWISLLVWIIALIVLVFSGVRWHKEFLRRPFFSWSESVTYEQNVADFGGMCDRRENLPSFSRLEIGKLMVGTIRIKKGDSAQILINGDDNIVDKIKWEFDDDNGKLKIGMDIPRGKNDTLHLNTNTIIVITTPQIHGLKMNGFNNISIDDRIDVPNFDIEVYGAGSFRFDSLYTSNLTCKTEGIRTVHLGGKANKAFLKLEGAGELDAYELETDSLDVQMQGIGSVRCNPITHMNASLDGVGRIAYKKEPKSKQIHKTGLGKISKE